MFSYLLDVDQRTSRNSVYMSGVVDNNQEMTPGTVRPSRPAEICQLFNLKIDIRRAILWSGSGWVPESMLSLGNGLACFTTRRGSGRRRCLMGILGEGKLVQERRPLYCRSSRAKQTLIETYVSTRKNFPIKHEFALDTRYSFVRAFAEQKSAPLKLWVDNEERLLPRGVSLSGHTSFRSSRAVVVSGGEPGAIIRRIMSKIQHDGRTAGYVGATTNVE